MGSSLFYVNNLPVYTLSDSIYAYAILEKVKG